MKILALAGASTGVMTAADNIINGKDWTSRDVSTVLQGLAAAGVGAYGVHSKVQQSKLAQKTAEKVVGKQAENLKLTKSGTAGGYEFKRTNEELEQFIINNPTKTKAIEAVQLAAKEEKGIELSQQDAAKILEQMGADLKGKGDINWTIKF